MNWSFSLSIKPFKLLKQVNIWCNASLPIPAAIPPPLQARDKFNHWMLIFSYRRSYYTPRRADILDTVRYRGMIICLHGLVCPRTNNIHEQNYHIYFFIKRDAPCTLHTHPNENIKVKHVFVRSLLNHW